MNGVNIQTIDPALLREDIAYVPQKSILFTGSIKENILWGKKDANMEEVKQAAEAACAHSFIEAFPEGYDTQLGQGGINLSGGQKQRLSIARALLKNSSVLILDDSTSALDAVTEQQLKQSLEQRTKGSIIFLIAQRITSVMDADKILIMENGKIVGIGTHDELRKNNAVYQEIIRSQIGEEMVSHGK